MNFFEHQDRARRQTRVLVVLFAVAVIAIVLAMNLVMLALLGRFETPDDDWISPAFWRYNAEIVLWTTLVTGLVIGLASSFRTLQLRGGGSQVARSLGGVPVEASTEDPLRRRLRNVVEEMAIASGVPVPAIYVLEHEPGINAFAAGWSPADAAVAVTRGALEHLDRDELQGVIAHEFSHVFNGDMRLNIRLMGILFGILVLAILGRRLLMSMRYSGRNRNAAAIVAFGLAVMVVGYIGLFFGRWIKASVSRQREFLADASAVQFTRHPDGIAGALKKIGAVSAGSGLEVDTEEVGHMLFARALGGRLFATHPPLADRIRAIDPSFEPAEFKRIAARLERHRQARLAEQEEAARSQAATEPARGAGGFPLDPEDLAGRIGQPGMNQLLLASALVAAIPKPLERAAHSDEWAPEVVCYLLMDPDPQIREKQLLLIAEALGSESESQVRALRQAQPELPAELRLPLLEMAFPALRRRPESELVKLAALIGQLIHADGRIHVFEYALGRLCSREIEDVLNPDRVRVGGRATLASRAGSVIEVMAIVARHGHADDEAAARAAFAAGIEGLVDSVPAALPDPGADWPEHMDAALEALDGLKAAEKRKLVAGLGRCVMHDGRLIPAEIELLRVIAGTLHVPLPLLATDQSEQFVR